MKRLLVMCATLFPLAAWGNDPPIPLPTGRYEFTHRFAEHPDMESITVIAEIIDDYIELTNADSDAVFPFGVLASGKLMWHAKSAQWIIAISDSAAEAEYVGGCSDGPDVVDLENRIYWTC